MEQLHETAPLQSISGKSISFAQDVIKKLLMMIYIESVERSHYRIFSGFMLELQAVQGYTGEVMRDFIVPLTNGSRCRFVELEVMRKSGVVGSGRGDDVYQLL